MKRVHFAPSGGCAGEASYDALGGELLTVALERKRKGDGSLEGLGLSLAGNKDRGVMSVFVVGVAPDSPADRSHNITQGDELLEVRPVRPRRKEKQTSSLA